ncbi:response regulator transcription factor [Cellulomonas oligotrophica]|uniref:DNA-binding response regulator n=1 Tax=Cellulomonas oligotrophica TaxID=931536 RepID=A0A7Y9FFX6_9CELL|nr:response regulator transcription factor [Cellulomonas oligotrophica]NYD86618.1 two-component system OmpR family response regulator [Cellulomonas oligotrophica]GIG32494.1 DNA-binding response regulator [Cellulomonas oligotrophica]
MSPRVLVVDDDPDVREMLVQALTFSGFDVTDAPDAVAALAVLGSDGTDVVLLDVMMPGLDGFDLVQLVRRRDPDLPVLFLSGRDAVDDRVRGLRLGADDYVTKPFSTVEVVARIEAVLRRRTAPGPAPDADDGVLRCADLLLDPAHHRVERAGAPVALSPTEFRLLALLLEHRGRVVSKGQILDQVWGYGFGGETNVVERFVSNLRRKVDDGHPALIRTVRGFGYAVRAPEA